jgi:N-methylhydantoinase A/oxoprolinase/acetone carboxylase beta subunit
MRITAYVDGTFTDLVYVDAQGVRQTKVSATRPRFDLGVINVIPRVITDRER